MADVKDFWNGQKHIEVLDPNITACKDKRDLFAQYIETGAKINFNQGLDIRLLNEEDIRDINLMKMDHIHFAWDNPKDDLKGKFENFVSKTNINKRNQTVYMLTNFDSTLDEDLYRVYTIKDLGMTPYVMIYNKPSASPQLKKLQRWVNNRFIFRSCDRFEDYEIIPEEEMEGQIKWENTNFIRNL